MGNLLYTSWGLQLACSAVVAVLLPRRRWAFRILAGLAAIADVVELPLDINTHRYFYVYWSFRIVELLWLAFATCHLMTKLMPQHAETIAYRFHWLPLVVSACAVVATGPWESNPQMEMLQAFILISCALPAWFYAAVFWRVHAMPLALGLLLLLEIICALGWRYGGYHVEGWFIAWITGMGLLWMADRADSS